MASALKGYELPGVLVKTAFGKVKATAELTKNGDFEMKGSTKGSCCGVDYFVGMKSLNLDETNINASLGYDHKFKFDNIKVDCKTELSVACKDVLSLDYKSWMPNKVVVSETIDTNISSTSIYYKPGKAHELMMDNNFGYEYKGVKGGLKFPTINLLAKEDPKKLAAGMELSLSGSREGIKGGVKVTNLGKDAQLFLEARTGFLKTKTTIKGSIPEKVVKSALETEVAISKRLSIAQVLALDGVACVKREQGIVLENDKKTLKLRGMFDNKGTKKIAIDHKIAPGAELHMVGVAPSKEDADNSRVFAVGLSFEA